MPPNITSDSGQDTADVVIPLPLSPFASLDNSTKLVRYETHSFRHAKQLGAHLQNVKHQGMTTRHGDTMLSKKLRNRQGASAFLESNSDVFANAEAFWGRRLRLQGR